MATHSNNKEKNMNHSVIAVFTCNAQHACNTYTLVGIATDTMNAIKIIKEFIKDENDNLPKEEHCKLSEDDERNLIDIKQTQNMENFNGEFIMEEKIINTLDT